MMQPVVITIEDLIQWVWRRAIGPKRKDNFTSFERFVGYVWTFVAFTLTLQPYVRGMIGVIGGSSPDEAAAFLLGQQHGSMHLQASHHHVGK